MWRFQARRTDNGFAVWDTQLSGWRSVQGLTETEAWQQASDLDILFDATGQRDPGNVRLLDEDPVPVDVAVWRPAGILDAWVREDGTWWGRIRDDTGRIHWHPAGDLRQSAEPDRPAEPPRPADPAGRAVPATPPPPASRPER